MSNDANPGTSATPSQCPARSMCAVEETGRYSVRPSTPPRITAWTQPIMPFAAGMEGITCRKVPGGGRCHEPVTVERIPYRGAGCSVMFPRHRRGGVSHDHGIGHRDEGRPTHGGVASGAALSDPDGSTDRPYRRARAPAPGSDGR